MSAFGTVMMGMFAPSALSLSAFTGPKVAASEWGELRTVRVTSRIRAQASTSSETVGMLATGDSVRVEPVPNGWFRVYEARLVPRLEAEPLGYVYGKLLIPTDTPLARSGSAAGS